MSKDEINLTPPSAVAQNAKKGLELRERFGRGGTKIGVTRAHQLKDRESLSPQTIARMVSYFARHTVDKQADNFGNDDDPSKGYIAWLLWGSDEGQTWAKKMNKILKDQRKLS